MISFVLSEVIAQILERVGQARPTAATRGWTSMATARTRTGMPPVGPFGWDGCAGGPVDLPDQIPGAWLAFSDCPVAKSKPGHPDRGIKGSESFRSTWPSGTPGGGMRHRGGGSVLFR